MGRLFTFLIVVFFSCTLPAEKKANKEAAERANGTTSFQTSDANDAQQESLITETFPQIQKVKNPNGIFQAILNLNEKIEHTIAFNSDYTFHLQERYPDRRDSIAVTQGTWTPSDGYIWLYKDQVVRGRYKWKGNTLQYHSPVLKKDFDMQRLQDAFENVAWRNKAKQGVVMFGVGNEPFWIIEMNNKDTLSFTMADWEHAVKLKMNSSFNTRDSMGYLAKNDSASLRVTLYPEFCSDGMSDFTYRKKVKVQFNQYVYQGCGMLYK
jgi:uncharacterized membrane protein